MGILNLGGSDEFEEFDEFEYSEFSEYDELDEQDAGTDFRGKRLIAIFVAGLFAVVGTTFGARVLLNSGTGIEYGQGFKVTVGCQDTALTVTPYAGFINEASGGVFSLDSIYIEGISNGCNGRDFVIDVYSNTDSTPLSVSESATAKTPSYVYKTFNTTRFYYQDSSTVISRTNAYTDFDVATDTSTGSTDTTGSLQITFDPDQVASFARATDVYKITVETQLPVATKD
ncbi:unannotated protein [freshwater metagenome]|uniref:Unannotated protein n=1 Tax=freshwater metagenome TaxID=449393 RepID=A0A6J6RPH6_9ZZZZ|nr:hypothetical protein [Actinomycetota bacterium]